MPGYTQATCHVHRHHPLLKSTKSLLCSPAAPLYSIICMVAFAASIKHCASLNLESSIFEQDACVPAVLLPGHAMLYRLTPCYALLCCVMAALCCATRYAMLCYVAGGLPGPQGGQGRRHDGHGRCLLPLQSRSWQ